MTWRILDTKVEHSRDFVDVDNGHDFYLLMKRDANSYGATWQHVTPPIT